jgi:hypothetical protein
MSTRTKFQQSCKSELREEGSSERSFTIAELIYFDKSSNQAQPKLGKIKKAIQ